ncbi:MAG: hypothetical protein A2838_02680 [Candidatus Zambryskibacteria bacterium RIFCSPHIGHO2_01_FULL_46_25]|uniref:C2H2-type domain-containing protein n=1 Tax=Candidatus Zambryskibacteria bacterium RIFCSPHIGHO2_01_FULL_46_25 TaxID=1802738 RepID=A0A1G2SZI5_9BACT|nr:MAG: hypothetical protein A2838_02680 [Candidatus Zambryskibacteria bacterium RIFCSPHIGHO2_01_FULL_46_25]
MLSEKMQKNIAKIRDKILGIFHRPDNTKMVHNKNNNEFEPVRNQRGAEICPFCLSADFVKRGTRKNRNQVVQLYLCRNSECGKTFTAQNIKGKHFPLHIIIESMSYYNLGLNLEETCRIIKKKFGVAPEPATLSDWINEYKELCRYERLRPFAIKMFSPKDTVEVVTMAHRQLYRFRYHRAKTVLMLEEFKNRILSPLKNYLDAVSSETPHQYFQDGERMSEIKSKFDKADMIVQSKFNYANRLTAFVLQSIPDNKQRHEELQRFMIANDSCTVATEVPVYIRREDVEHMENQLKFKITERPSAEIDESIEPSSRASRLGAILLKGDKKLRPFPKLLTGHIDIVQIRNGQVHLLDYKPNASKERPIEQLTWYALAMSRLTGLRIYNFVCAWFDEKDYYQFYPLHVVKKIAGTKKRRVRYRSGEVVEVPRENKLTIVPKNITKTT